MMPPAFSAANLLGSVIFGGIGFAAFIYGKKQVCIQIMIIGILLMIYPYFVPQTWMMYLVGVLLTGSLYFLRE